MAFGTNTTTFLLKQGTYKIGVWTNPETIGTDATQFDTKFSGDVVGNIKAGTATVEYPSEFVSAESGTPRKLLRKDPIRCQFNIMGEIFELNADIFATIQNRRVQANYAVTIPTAQTWQLAHVGSDQPTRVTHGFLIDTLDVNGRIFQFAMYAGLETSEDQKSTLAGDDYVTTSMKFEATPHPNFTTLAQDQDNYGYIAQRTA